MKHTLIFSEKAVTLHEFGDHSNHALLFIHGNSVPSSFFIPLIQFLDAKYYIITLDLPGHRQSEAWEKEDFTPKNLASLFNSILEYFSIEEVDAFGFSMGGLILLECFDLMPAVKKLAVAGHPPLSAATDMPDAYRLNEDTSLILQGILSDEETERIYNALIAIEDSQLKSEIKQALIETSPLFREGCLQIALNVSDQISKLNQLSHSIAVIHAADDLAIQFEYLQNLQINNLWEQKIQVIPECGHFMIGEKSDKLAAILDRYFSEN